MQRFGKSWGTVHWKQHSTCYLQHLCAKNVVDSGIYEDSVHWNESKSIVLCMKHGKFCRGPQTQVLFCTDECPIKKTRRGSMESTSQVQHAINPQIWKIVCVCVCVFFFFVVFGQWGLFCGPPPFLRAACPNFTLRQFFRWIFVLIAVFRVPVPRPKFLFNGPKFPLNGPKFPLNGPKFPLNGPKFPLNGPNFRLTGPNFRLRPQFPLSVWRAFFSQKIPHSEEKMR